MVVLEGALDLRRYGNVAPLGLSLRDDGRPLVVELRNALGQVAAGVPARVRIEAAGARPREAAGQWSAEYILATGPSSEELRAVARATVGGRDLVAYLAALQARQPGRQVRITVQGSGSPR